MAKPPVIVLLSVCLLLSSPLYAHRLKVFATAEGSRIEGEAYFVGGGRAAGAIITVHDAKGRELARLTPDEAGSFSYTATQRMDHELVADTRDGHKASWTVRADELPLALALPPDANTASPAESGQPTRQQPSPPPAMSTDSALDSLVERAVARQVRPLREQLTAYGDQVRLHDILGGFGYIAGIAGLALWWRGRRQKG